MNDTTGIAAAAEAVEAGSAEPDTGPDVQESGNFQGAY
jgi:hypothetical protein